MSSRLRNKPRTRYNELGAMDSELLDKTSVEFCRRLEMSHIHPQFNKPMFKSPGDVVEGLKGKEFDCSYIQQNGLSIPVKFKSSERDDLGIKLPCEDITPKLVAKLVGENRSIVAMSVASQNSNVNMKLKNWAAYFESPELREEKGVLNLISLEFSGTKLASQVISPNIVREIDWIDRAWPHPCRALKSGTKSGTRFKHKGAGSDSFGRPKVQKYCLMSAAGSFTDFHIDFGGTSVWYHLVKGKKVFLLAPPSKQVLDAFQQFTWDSSSYMPDLLPASTFTRCTLSAGETLFIPSGWIHAVYTPVDSLVFGGNFLHNFSVKPQADIMMLEERTFVQAAMRFPLANELLWRIALVILCEMMTHPPRNQPAATIGKTGWLGGEVEATALRIHLGNLLARTEAPDWVSNPKVLLKCFQDVLKGTGCGEIEGVDLEHVPFKLEQLEQSKAEEPKKEDEEWYLRKVKLCSNSEEVKVRGEVMLEFEHANATAKQSKKKSKKSQSEEVLSEVLTVGQLVRAKYKKSAMFYKGVLVGVLETKESSKGNKGWMKNEYMVAFDDGDFDPCVKREHIKGRVLDQDWITQRIEVKKRLSEHQKRESKKKKGKKRVKASSCPFTHPTESMEEQGVKRLRAMSHPLMKKYRSEFRAQLEEFISLRPNVSEDSVMLANAYEEAHLKLRAQVAQMKGMSNPLVTKAVSS